MTNVCPVKMASLKEEASRGSGLNPSGQRGGNAPREGAPTELDVKLQQEKLAGMEAREPSRRISRKPASRRGRKLDYRNVKSELSPAQKDLLNQDKFLGNIALLSKLFPGDTPAVKK